MKKVNKKDVVVKSTTPKKSKKKIDELLETEKKEIIKAFGLHEKDNGSPEVQIALLTKRIEQLADHLKTHKKDNHSRRGILQLVGRRRRMLQYLSKKEPERYQGILDKVGLKK